MRLVISDIILLVYGFRSHVSGLRTSESPVMRFSQYREEIKAKGLGCGFDLLCESLALPLQQAVPRFSPLELRLHDTQRLPGREHGLAILERSMSGDV